MGITLIKETNSFSSKVNRFNNLKDKERAVEPGPGSYDISRALTSHSISRPQFPNYIYNGRAQTAS
jgi:hypothetical protein